MHRAARPEHRPIPAQGGVPVVCRLRHQGVMGPSPRGWGRPRNCQASPCPVLDRQSLRRGRGDFRQLADLPGEPPRLETVSARPGSSPLGDPLAKMARCVLASPAQRSIRSRRMRGSRSAAKVSWRGPGGRMDAGGDEGEPSSIGTIFGGPSKEAGRGRWLGRCVRCDEVADRRRRLALNERSEGRATGSAGQSRGEGRCT